MQNNGAVGSEEADGCIVSRGDEVQFGGSEYDDPVGYNGIHKVDRLEAFVVEWEFVKADGC